MLGLMVYSVRLTWRVAECPIIPRTNRERDHDNVIFDHDSVMLRCRMSLSPAPACLGCCNRRSCSHYSTIRQGYQSPIRIYFVQSPALIPPLSPSNPSLMALFGPTLPVACPVPLSSPPFLNLFPVCSISDIY